MADSRRESALKALLDLLQGIAWTNAPAPQVERNEAEAREIPAGGLVSLRDGDPGEPEVYLSPPAYAFAHEAEVIVQYQASTAATRDAWIDALLRDVGDALAADPTLGGAVEMASPGAPDTMDEPVEGAAAIKAVRVPVVLDYVTDSPLG
ncbi:hypothetical protein [Shumkonia mesophila]|uniref:hypothetical protein n=1 Tax=Shumkonia mesophila TaxID=2838854 RepID=UPI002934B986|nr:hypothetical protein [Shumkonia mesophila]